MQTFSKYTREKQPTAVSRDKDVENFEKFMNVIRKPLKEESEAVSCFQVLNEFLGSSWWDSRYT